MSSQPFFGKVAGVDHSKRYMVCQKAPPFGMKPSPAPLLKSSLESKILEKDHQCVYCTDVIEGSFISEFWQKVSGLLHGDLKGECSPLKEGWGDLPFGAFWAYFQGLWLFSFRERLGTFAPQNFLLQLVGLGWRKTPVEARGFTGGVVG